MTTVLECAGVTSGYGGVPAIRGVDLSVAAGEVVALLGPNGAGKTTTLLTLSGVVPALSGDVRVLGQPVRHGRPHLNARLGLAHVPDDRALFNSLTVKENLRLGLGKGSPGDTLGRVMELFPALEQLKNRKAGLLSGGQQQMLALGRAVATDPKALIVDEMTLGLAPVIAKGLLPVLRRLATEHGTGILLVEQHVDLALQVADRAYVLNHGDIVLDGAAADLRSRRDLLRASYMGEEVYEDLEGPLAGENGRVTTTAKRGDR